MITMREIFGGIIGGVVVALLIMLALTMCADLHYQAEVGRRAIAEGVEL